MDLHSFLPVCRIVFINNIDDGLVACDIVQTSPTLADSKLNRIGVDVLDGPLAYTGKAIHKPKTGAVDILFLLKRI